LFEELDILLFGKKGVTPFIAYAAVSIQFYFLLSKFCERYLEDDHFSLVNSLMTGLGGMDSARAGIEIWKLANSAGENKKIRESLLTSPGYDEFREKVVGFTGSEEYLAQWDKFFREHGHHTRGEIEFINKRWSEDPGYILGIVKAYLESPPPDPMEEEERQAANRKKVIVETRKRLKNPLKRAVFNYLLINAQTGSLVRENVKGDAIKVIEVYRRALLETGRRMVERKLTESVDDIFFLEERELRKYLRYAKRSPRVLKMIDERKREREENEQITPPPVIMGDVADNVTDIDPMPNLKEMKGLGVSAGLAKGRARVILHTEDGAVEPGEILVAPFTDPGWTPYFIPASGIVMDMGGLLSHGSIVAREYGIPAVVNINGATKIIKTGQMILVNGNKGVVIILDEE
jgi:pyruvate,water dikinase